MKVADTEVMRMLSIRLSNAQARSRQQRWACNIDLPWLVDRYNGIAGCCEITGLPLDSGPVKANSGRDRRPFRISLDRKDSERGYTRDNVRIVCACINYALGSWGDLVLQIMARSLVAHANRETPEIVEWVGDDLEDCEEELAD
ncbi:MAG: hypothetical protein ACR2RE_13480 [Geminicoccaceae bacterium]